MSIRLLTHAAAISVCALALDGALLAAQAGPTSPLTGRWLVTSGVAFAPWTLELTQHDSAVTGSIRQAGGITGPSDLQNGLVQGNHISFKTASPQGGRTITFVGVIAADSIAFARTVEDPDGTVGGTGVFGANGPPRFSMRRATSLDAPATVDAINIGPTVAGAERWVATEGVATAWIFDIVIGNGGVTGEARQRSANATGTLSVPYQLSKGRSSGDTIEFTLDYGAGARIISFRGVRHGDVIDFTRHAQIVSGSAVGTGILGPDGATAFQAKRLPRGQPIPASAPPVRQASSAADPGAPTKVVSYRGFTIDITAVASTSDRDSVLDAVHGQFDLIEGVSLSAETRAFFKSIPMVMTPGNGTAAYGAGRIAIPIHSTAPYDKDHPIILHELCHAYHDKKLPDGFRNAEVLALFDTARKSGQFPARSYMLSNPAEYFAMMASVYLYGSAMRDPFARDSIRVKQPGMTRLLGREFGPR